METNNNSNRLLRFKEKLDQQQEYFKTRLSIIVNFVQQHRCVDAQFQEILNVISYYKPSRRTLKELHGKRVLCSPEPTEAELLSVLQDHPDGMILKVTRAAAATINRIAVNNLFPDVDPCGHVKYDGTDKFQPI